MPPPGTSTDLLVTCRPGYEDLVADPMTSLRNLYERAEGAGEGSAILAPLRQAEETFRTGDTARTVQFLSRALIEASRSRVPEQAPTD